MDSSDAGDRCDQSDQVTDNGHAVALLPLLLLPAGRWLMQAMADKQNYSREAQVLVECVSAVVSAVQLCQQG